VETERRDLKLRFTRRVIALWYNFNKLHENIAKRRDGEVRGDAFCTLKSMGAIFNIMPRFICIIFIDWYS